MQRWYATVTNKGSPHEQGLVIDETTGANVAVTYDPKHAALIARAPALRAALAAVLPYAENEAEALHELRDSDAAEAEAERASAAVAAARDVLNSITLED